MNPYNISAIIKKPYLLAVELQPGYERIEYREMQWRIQKIVAYSMTSRNVHLGAPFLLTTDLLMTGSVYRMMYVYIS